MDRHLQSDIVRAPAMRAAVPFMAGLVLARIVDPSVGTAWMMAAGAAVCMFILVAVRTRFRHRWLRGMLLTLGMLLLGVLWQVIRDPFHARHAIHPNADGDQLLLVELEELSYSSVASARFEARSIAAMKEDVLVPSSGRLYLTVALDSMLEGPAVRDRLWIEARISAIDRIPDPGGFDRKTFAASEGIAIEAFVPKGKWTVASHRTRWTDVFSGARERISVWLAQSGLPSRERALAKALVLGVRDELEDDQKTAFSRSGTMHVLAVSGMHVGLIFIVFSAMLGWWGQRPVPRLLRGMIILLALWSYAGLTGAAPSVLRATIMFTLFTVASMSGRQSGSLNSLFAAALLLLLWDPLMLVQLSFQLSFLAVLGIVLFYRPILHLWSPPNKVLHYAWSMAAVSIAAQLTTTPLSMMVFKAFPLWFLPANIIVVGVVSLAVYGSVLLILLFKVPVIGVAITWCMTQLLLFLGWSTAWFGALPGAYPGIRVDGLQCVLMYGLIAAGAAWLAWRMRGLKWSFSILLLAALISWAWQAYRTNGTVRFTVHDQRQDLVASLQRGRELVITADSALTSQLWMTKRTESQQRATGAELRARGTWSEVHDEKWKALGSAMVGSGFWTMPELRVKFATAAEVPMIGPMALDALVLIEDARHDLEGLSSLAARVVVLSPAINGLERYRIRNWCEEHGINCHDIKRQGAFILEKGI